MTLIKPRLALGLEEEYLLVDPKSRDLVRSPTEAFMPACRARLGDQVTCELLQAQIEVGTRVCASIGEARAELAQLRAAVAAVANEHGMVPIAASTHPFACWDEQRRTELERYQTLTDDFQVLARRQMVCGMHVHAEIADEDLRIDLMNQMVYFLPHLLALSTSSPFWRGQATGLKAIRPTIFTDLPRSGMPEPLESWRDWQRLLETMDTIGLCSDPTQIWWEIRPSGKHPTLELRSPDICTKLEDAITIAALYQALLHRLWRLRACNQSWRRYRRILIEENRWRAQRWGIEAELADFGAARMRPLGELVAEMVDLVREDAGALDCLAEVERANLIVAEGTSADRQLAVHAQAVEGGADSEEACRAVVDWLIQTTLEGTAASC
jgi:carboxylate-amine ligase